MKTVKIKTNPDKINWAIPDQSVRHNELTDAIKKAEEGPFHSVEESKQDFEKWLNTRKKQ